MRGSIAAVSAISLAAAFLYVSNFVGGWLAIRTSRRHRIALASLQGKVVLVTGGNSGVGLGCVRDLAVAGATVVLACRSLAKAEAAVSSMDPDVAARVTIMALDLASIASIRAFAADFSARFERLHVLILNGAVASTFMGSDGFARTADGFEEMVGTNFLGHFLLTVLLLPILRSTPRARVIGQTSVAMANSYSCGIDVKSWVERRPDFQDWKQYSQSKLAIRLFMKELQRRNPSLLCLACHPGVIAGTNLMRNQKAGALERIYSTLIFALGMASEHAHLNTVYLATAPAEELEGGGCYTPIGRRLDWMSHPLQRLGALQLPTPMRTPEPCTVWEAAEQALTSRGALVS